jgi:hypothetical protein
MRPFLIAAGLLCVVVVSVAIAGGGAETATNSELAARIDALTKELESLKPLPKQVTELEEKIRELELQIGVLRAQPVTTQAPSTIPRNAIPREINGTTFYIIPIGNESPTKGRPVTTTKLP